MSPVAFNQVIQSEIRKLITDASIASAFIDAAGVAVAGYSEIATAWSGPTPGKARKTIEKLGRRCRALIAQIVTIDEWTEEHLREAQVLDGTYDQPSLEDLRADLRRLSNACVRAAALPELNRGKGNVGDDARHDLIRKLAAAYKLTTGETPSPSSDGTFAKLLRIVLKAVGAKAGGSNDLLKKLI